MADLRAQRLNRLFNDVLKGEKSLTPNNSKLFLEALCKQTPAVNTIMNLVASKQGLDALLLALSSDSSLNFLNGHLTTFVEYIQAPDLQAICGGDALRQVLDKFLVAPLLWKSLIQAARDRTLNENALYAFSWLLVQFLSRPVAEAMSFLPVAQDSDIQKPLLDSSSIKIVNIGHLIVQKANTLGGFASTQTPVQLGPGGRHDNDFADIRKISIYPTAEELRTVNVYLPRASDVEQQTRGPDGLANHIDSQFRLLRADMIFELLEEMAQFNNWRRKHPVINNLVVHGVYCDQHQPWSLLLAPKPEHRKQFERDHLKILKEGFPVGLFVDDDFVTFGTVVRKEELTFTPMIQKGDLSVNTPSVVCIQLPTTNLRKVLTQLMSACYNIKILQCGTAIFSYEPVLNQLKETRELSLTPEIVSWQVGAHIPPPAYHISNRMQLLLDDLYDDYARNLQSCLRLKQPTRLDKSQAKCFRVALQQRVALIQGPPGTGKSFIGSLATKAILESSKEKILVVCFTHHALDDFLESLLDLGVPEEDMVRLGFSERASAGTQALALSELKKEVKLTSRQYEKLQTRKMNAAHYGEDLRKSFTNLMSFQLNPREFLYFMQFHCDHPALYQALRVPFFERPLRRNGDREVDKYYLVKRWIRGEDAGIFKPQMSLNCQNIWALPLNIRKQKYHRWCQKMIKEELARTKEAGSLYNNSVAEARAVFKERDLKVIRNKRIIACTTTAAANNAIIIRSISPGVVIVEEAGEVLESHVLTALGPDTKHLIMIGDHKQLRPKVNYELSVEKGTGYDLNRSLFERLILKRFPYDTLQSQHRMRPEISALVRKMTYPELQDAKDTRGRPDLRGVSDNIVFVNHKEAESKLSGLEDSRSNTSKQNLFEAEMALKCVRYLCQQGYSMEDIVVLTPYLGQRELLTQQRNKNETALRISTIDNFQGEEANIVVASLTRSNDTQDIGFMYAPERLSVLVSRARNALILIGNAEHFMGSRKGGELWKKFINQLKAGNHVYDGFPVCCELHPDTTAILRKPRDFDTKCPGGVLLCNKPCNRKLRCGIHNCTEICHPWYHHTKIKCTAVVVSKCSKRHDISWKCYAKSSVVCVACQVEAQNAQEEYMRKMKVLREQHWYSIIMPQKIVKAKRWCSIL